jgi:hypothetical protein
MMVFMGTMACAQFDLGLSAGAYVFTIRPRGSTSAIQNKYTPTGHPLPTFSLSYNERTTVKGADLTLAVDYVYKEFHAFLYSGGHFGSSTELDLQLHLLYFTVAPDIHLDPGGNSALRIGLQFGTLLSGHERGMRRDQGVDPNGVYYSTVEQVNGRTNLVGGDLRALFGLRVMPLISGKRWLMVDMYSSFALSGLVRGEASSRGMDMGLRAGYLLHCERRALTKLMDDLAPVE